MTTHANERGEWCKDCIHLHCLACDVVDTPHTCPCHSKSHTGESWEERFEKRFGCICDDPPHDKPNHTPSFYARDIDELKSFISTLLKEAREEEKAKLNDCTCKEKWTFGVVHRKDKPCYWPPHEKGEEKA